MCLRDRAAIVLGSAREIARVCAPRLASEGAKRGAALSLSCFFLIASLAPVWAQAKGDWKQTWDTVLREAKKEGKVVVFGPPGDVIRKAVVEGFSQAFPEITIEYSGARGSDHVAKIRAERDAGIYSVDVFNGNNLVANFNLRPIGGFDPVRPTLILPEVTELKYWRDGRLEFLRRRSPSPGFHEHDLSVAYV